MSDETTQGQGGSQPQGGRGGRGQHDNDRDFAERQIAEKERRDNGRFETLRQQGELTARAVSQTGVKLDDIDMKVNALMEKAGLTADRTTPIGWLDQMIHTADQKIRRVAPYVTVAGAAVAVGYGGYRGVQAVRGMMRKKIDVHADVTIKPVGEPVPIGDR